MPVLHIYCDGGSRRNPGPAGAGVAAYEIDDAGNKKCILEKALFLQNRSNNYAEYKALVTSLHYAMGVDHKKIQIFSDSRLVVEQINGAWKVKCEELKPLYQEADKYAKSIRDSGVDLTITWISRDKNVHADTLAGLAIDRETDAEYKYNHGLKDQLENWTNTMIAHEEAIKAIQKNPNQTNVEKIKDSWNSVVNAWTAVKI
jgi:ribonuclease HI